MKVFAEALRRDAAALLEQYEARRWVPEQAERELAEGLARGQWGGAFFRACLRDVPLAVRSGRLVDVLAPAADVRLSGPELAEPSSRDGGRRAGAVENARHRAHQGPSLRS